jgi:4-hydroxy-3-polyprenylbenzoate decarboxylase
VLAFLASLPRGGDPKRGTVDGKGRAMPVEFADLREWIDRVDAMGELTRVSGAHWDLEIGGLAALQEHRVGNAALLFDDIPGHKPGQRVLTNTMMSNPRVALTLGAESQSDPIAIVQYWRDLARDLPLLPPVEVDDGPVNENVLTGDDVDLLAFPTPRWHEDDGGRYIGTGCVVAMKDPAGDWVNLGTYRVMIHDRNRVGIYISPGKQGRLIRDAYWSRGEPCPVVISVGQDPLLTSLGGIEIPYGTSEYDVAGGIRGSATEVITSDLTGLPLPARAEIVLEGFIHEGEVEEEGPFGEWSGYYAGGRRPAPVVRIERIRHRNDPILLGSLTSRSPADAAYYRGILRSAMVWEQLESAGIQGVNGVWLHEASGSRMWITVSLTQKYAGHAKQAGLIASQCRGLCESVRGRRRRRY